MNGYFNIYKPSGMSSAAVVAVMRRLTGEKRVGHAGTLDPEAAGVLPVMTGRATRLFDYLVDKEKEYVAVIAFGSRTDTQDATGAVLETGEDYPTIDRVRAEATQLVGEIRQTPSVYSAIKVNGKPLYLRARKGEDAKVPERIVHIDRIDVLREVPDHGMELHVVCGRGTYIRTLCDDLGQLCGCPAHMRSLVRTRSGVFTMDQAITLEEARQRAADGTLADCVLPPDMPLAHLPAILLPESCRKKAEAGAAIPAAMVGESVPEQGDIGRAYLSDQFWGILERHDDQLLWRVQMPPE